MKKAIFLNGEIPSDALLAHLNSYEEIICADGAYNYLKKLKIVPDRVFGDFDSIQETKLDSKKFTLTENQDYTDFEKILMILDKEIADEIHIFGGSGKEQDHFLGNLTVANKWKNRFKIIFFDEYHYYFFSERNWIGENLKGKTISLMPFPNVFGISSEGLQYRLNNDELNIEKRVGSRNRAIENKVKISYNNGNLIIFVARK